MASVGVACTSADGEAPNQMSPASHIAPSVAPAINKPRSAGITIFSICWCDPAGLYFSSQAAGRADSSPSSKRPKGLLSNFRQAEAEMGNINPSVDLRRDGEIAVITADNPPVNALKHELRAGLVEALRQSRDDPAVKAVVIGCAGRTFFAGADITEFGKPPQAPGLGEVIAAIEAMPKPVVAALHGTALGGGLELALACHFRVAVPSARVGLPEVKLGLFPGPGGTQRLPRLIGPEKALKMIVTGDPIEARAAP